MPTDDGARKLAEASGSHLAAVAEFREYFSDGELETLAELLGRFPGGDGGDCVVDRA